MKCKHIAINRERPAKAGKEKGNISPKEEGRNTARLEGKF